MRFGKFVRQGWLPVLATAAFFSTFAIAQTQDKTSGRNPGGAASSAPQSAPAYKVADRSVPLPNRSGLDTSPAKPNEHPLVPAIRWARQGQAEIEKNIQDYSATIVKRERLDGQLGEYEYMFLKVRQKPFSVYMHFLDPPSVKGQEVIYVEGQNNGKMWAHPPGLRNKLIGTVSLDPTGLIAMRGQRYPITEIGMANLIKRLIEIGERDAQYGECEVKFFQGAKINDRSCTCIQVMHPVPRRNFLFHIARIFVDDELNLPLRYESHDWPAQPGGQPQLIEEYTYLNLKINNGFTDADFDVRNPNYQFNVD
jgi:outer membrane lipoprotein-sorting protein